MDATRKRGRLLFWQEEVFRHFAAETGITISKAEEFVRLLDFAIAKILSEPAVPPANNGRISLALFAAQCPPDYTPVQWQRQVSEAAAFHEKQALATDAIMRQAKAWHDQANLLADEAAAAKRDGNVPLADNQLREAFAYARRAADHCRNVDELEPVTSYHRIAAQYALACDDFQEAVRLASNTNRALIPGNWDVVEKRLREVGAQIQAIEEDAESQRQRLVGTPLNEVTFPGRCAAFSPDSQHLAQPSDDRIHVYELRGHPRPRSRLSQPAPTNSDSQTAEPW